MTTLTCPKCRQGLPDDALDAGQCHLCGFPLDGPVVLGAPDTRRRKRLALAVGGALLALVVVDLVVFNRVGSSPFKTAPEAAALPTAEPQPDTGVRHVAPFPHEPKKDAETVPVDPPTKGDEGRPVPIAVVPPKRDGPRPVGVVMKVDPKIAPQRHFDHPDDTAALPDLNSGDRVTLTGRVRVLRLGSVNGKGALDASGLVAEEVVITGDLNGEALVLVNAPNGKVTVGGYVIGAAKLTIVAPGGEVVVAHTGRVTGGATMTVTAKRLEVNCPLSGGAKVAVTLTAGGSLKLTRAEEGATVTYRRAAPTDPPPTIEKGELHGGAKVLGP